MIKPIQFFVPYVPGPKQGDRSCLARKKTGEQYIRHHPSTKVGRDAKNLATLISPFCPAKPLTGPLFLRLAFRWPWRKGEPRRSKIHGFKYKDTWPDWDNLAKQVCDVMEKVGFFNNDSQIVNGQVVKLWGSTSLLGVDLHPAPPIEDWIKELINA